MKIVCVLEEINTIDKGGKYARIEA